MSKPSPATYDEKSFELAEHFLADNPQSTDDDKRLLARHIQNAVEEWLSIMGFDQ